VQLYGARRSTVFQTFTETHGSLEVSGKPATDPDTDLAEARSHIQSHFNIIPSFRSVTLVAACLHIRRPKRLNLSYTPVCSASQPLHSPNHIAIQNFSNLYTIRNTCVTGIYNTMVRPTKCTIVKLFYIQYTPTCFGHLRDHLQGGIQRAKN
jgi:hypothetical protein